MVGPSAPTDRPNTKSRNPLPARLLVAAVAIPALLWVFHAGSWWIRGLVVVLCALGCYEAWRLSARVGAAFILPLAVPLAALTPWNLGYPIGGWWTIWLVAILLAGAISALWKGSPERGALSAAAQIAIVLWIGIGFGALTALRYIGIGDGYRWLLFLFANLWIGDTAAYGFGAWLGKRRLAPTISPNKTAAGAVAQVLTSIVIGIVFAWNQWITVSGALLVTAAAVIAVVGQVGDLFESILKRVAGVKDSSAIIPGHGGVLDRFDSTLFAAPTLWVLIHLWPR